MHGPKNLTLHRFQAAFQMVLFNANLVGVYRVRFLWSLGAGWCWDIRRSLSSECPVIQVGVVLIIIHPKYHIIRRPRRRKLLLRQHLGEHVERWSRSKLRDHVTAPVYSDEREVVLVVYHVAPELRPGGFEVEGGSIQDRFLFKEGERRGGCIEEPRSIGSTLCDVEAHLLDGCPSAFVADARVGITVINQSLHQPWSNVSVDVHHGRGPWKCIWVAGRVLARVPPPGIRSWPNFGRGGGYVEGLSYIGSHHVLGCEVVEGSRCVEVHNCRCPVQRKIIDPSMLPCLTQGP
mmetsp:Transcript_35831/g.43274  ORF Transcript_35831/g.43274 Transcript_35831/m.43274 type:complete len:291 (+) Transcript_35831:188-1060(+)